MSSPGINNDQYRQEQVNENNEFVINSPRLPQGESYLDWKIRRRSREALSTKKYNGTVAVVTTTQDNRLRIPDTRHHLAPTRTTTSHNINNNNKTHNMVDESTRLLTESYNNNNVTSNLPPNSHWDIVKETTLDPDSH